MSASPDRSRSVRWRDDAGSAVVDFALVGSLLSLLFVSVVQLALVVHVRNTLVDCAAEGARYGARADRSPADGVARTKEMVARSLSSGYARRLGSVTASTVDRDGVRVVQVRVSAPLPVVGLAGPPSKVTVSGHAYVEGQ